MTQNNRNFLKRCTDKLYGGLCMNWLVVVLYALGTALLTTVF